MNAEIISVGTELLLGSELNINAAFLARQCAQLGIRCYNQTIVGDIEEHISAAVKQAMGRAEVVIISGGLGPTRDDITRETVSRLLGRELIEVQAELEHIRGRFEALGQEMPDNNRRQAMVPEGAIILHNPDGTAPGLIIEEGKTHIILLPGAHSELEALFLNEVYPYLAALNPGTILSQTVKICGVSESEAETIAEDLVQTHGNPRVATCSVGGEVHFLVTAQAEGEKECRKLIKPVVKELKSRFGANIFTTEPLVTIEQVIVDLLRSNELTLTTAESCTGGLIASRIVSVPGASEMFREGFVTYSNKAKRKYLGVRKSTLVKYGAVSENTAREMAMGGCDTTKSDVCVAVTGIAGPDGGTAEKPVGLVYISVCVCQSVAVRKFHFIGGRQRVRESAAFCALVMLRECLLEYFSRVTFGQGKKRK